LRGDSIRLWVFMTLAFNPVRSNMCL